MLAYCNNRPINFSDSSGNLPMRNVMLMTSDSGLNIQGRAAAQKRILDKQPNNVRYFLTPAEITTFQANNLDVRLGKTYSASHGELGSSEGVTFSMDTLSVGGGLNFGSKGVFADIGAYLINDSISIPFLFDTRFELNVHVGYGFTFRVNANGLKLGIANLIGISAGLVWNEEPPHVQYTRAQTRRAY